MGAAESPSPGYSNRTPVHWYLRGIWRIFGLLTHLIFCSIFGAMIGHPCFEKLNRLLLATNADDMCFSHPFSPPVAAPCLDIVHATAKATGRNSNNSQFFITFAPLPWLDAKHVVFGKVKIDGQNLQTTNIFFFRG